MDEKEKQTAAMLLSMSEEEFTETINSMLENAELKNGKLQILQYIISILTKFTQYEESYKKLLILFKIGVNKFGKDKEIRIIFQRNMSVAYEKLGRFAYQKSRFEEALKYLEEALKIHREIGDQKGEANNLTNIGNVYVNLEQYEEALKYLEEALKIHREIGDRQEEGNDLTNIGNVYAELGQYEEALMHFEEALKIRREIGTGYANLGQYEKALKCYEYALKIDRKIGDQRGEGHDLTDIGIVYEALGQYKKALMHFEEALKIAREIGNRKGEGYDLTDIGIVYEALGQYKKALKHFEEALKIAREIGDKRGEGADLTDIGDVYRDLGHYEEALKHFEEALKIAREIGDKRGEGADLGNIGNVYAELGQYEEALEYYKEALKIAREIGDKRGEGADLGNIGLVYANLGQYEEALEYYENALKIRREIGDKKGKGDDLGNIGNVYAELGQYEEALKYYEYALKICKEIGNKKGEGTGLTNIGNVYTDLGQYEEALKYYEEALKIRREIIDRQGEGSDLGNIGNVYANLGQYKEALEYYKEALKICKEIGDQRREGNDLTDIGNVYADLGQYKKAYSYEKRAIELFDQIIESVSSEFTTSALTAMKNPYRNGLNYLLKAIQGKAEENSELIKDLPEIIEKKKSRRLAKNFKEKIGMLNRDKLNEVINEIRAKDTEISSLIKNGEKLERNKIEGNEEGLARIEKRINVLIKERDELFEEEKALVPGLRFESIKHLKEVLKGKNKKSLILEISVIENYEDNKEKKEAIDKAVFALLNSEDDEIKMYEKDIKELEKREIERYKLIDELLYRKGASIRAKIRTRDTIEKIKGGKELEELEKEIENLSTGARSIEKNRVKSAIKKKLLLRKEILEELIKEYGGDEEKFIEVLGKPDIFYEEAERLKRTIIPEELFNEINMYYDRGFKYLFVSPEGEYHNVPWEAVKSKWKGNSDKKTRNDTDSDIPFGIKFNLVRMFSADATSASIERESRSLGKGILTIASVFHKEKQDEDDETGTVKSIGEKALGENRVVVVAGKEIDVGKENVKDKFAESKVIHISTHGKSGTINVKYRIKSTKEKINEIKNQVEKTKAKKFQCL